jgi:hypothetical protein
VVNLIKRLELLTWHGKKFMQNASHLVLHQQDSDVIPAPPWLGEGLRFDSALGLGLNDPRAKRSSSGGRANDS